MKFRHKSDRIPGLVGNFGCSWSFEKVLFILKMKFQNAFCCFQKTQTCSSPFFLRTPFFLRMDCCLSSFFLRMEGAQGGPKKGGCIPLFIFLWIASSGYIYIYIYIYIHSNKLMLRYYFIAYRRNLMHVTTHQHQVMYI